MCAKAGTVDVGMEATGVRGARVETVEAASPGGHPHVAKEDASLVMAEFVVPRMEAAAAANAPPILSLAASALTHRKCGDFSLFSITSP
jgi:hypothetical protein